MADSRSREDYVQTILLMSLGARIEQIRIPSIVPSFPDVLVYLLLRNKLPEVGYFIIMFVHGFGGVRYMALVSASTKSLERGGWRDGEGAEGSTLVPS